MKKLFAIFMAVVMLAALVPAQPVQAQAPVPFPVVGPTEGYPNCLTITWMFADQSIYRKDMVCAPLPVMTPKPDLVVYGHGYVAPGPVVDFPWDQMVLGEGASKLDVIQNVTGLGYWFATTTYHENGLAVKEGMQDLAELTALVKAAVYSGDVLGTNIAELLPYITFPVTIQHTYLVGVSEGGWITTLSNEANPKDALGQPLYNGTLAMCGPIGSFQKQSNYFGDFRVVFDYYFPQVVPNLDYPIPHPGYPRNKLIVPPEVIANGEGIIAAALYPLTVDPTAQAKLAKVIQASNAIYDPLNPATMVKTAGDILWYDIFANNDAYDKLGGEPFENRLRFYYSGADYRALNKGVQRVASDSIAVINMKALTPTGRLTMPLVTLHTTMDDVIPFWQEALYLGKVIAAGKTSKFLPLPVNAYGHCNFTPQQVLTAFGLMVYKVTGQAPAGLGLPMPSATRIQANRESLKKVTIPK